MEGLPLFQYLVTLIIVLQAFTMAASTPISNEDVQRYLANYQYIGNTSPDPDMQVGEIREGPRLSEALRSFQGMAGLPETGVADKETVKWMQKPRCGFPDVLDINRSNRGKRYALLGNAKWHKNDLTYRIHNYPYRVSQTETDYWIREAFETWSSVTPLRFYQLHRGQSDINIEFRRLDHYDGYAFDGPGGTLAHAFGPGENIGGDAHFDDDETWTIRQPHDGNDLYTVAVHELGHSLGLAHSRADKAIMRPFYEFSSDTGYLALSRDDVAGIQYLYGQGNRVATRPPVEPPSPPTARPTIKLPTTTRPVPTRPPVPVPEHCGRDVHLDAIVSTSSGKTYAFEGWRFLYIWEGNVLDMSSPKLVSEVFEELHWGVDAAFTATEHGREVIYIIKAWFVWKYDAETLRPIKKLIPRGDIFPNIPNSPCGAFRSEYDGYVYIFHGGLYWRIEGDHNGVFSGKVSPGYPRPLSDWGLPVRKIDGAMSWQGDTYFFAGNDYFKYDHYTNQVVEGYPREVSVWWLGCPDEVRQWPMVGQVREGNSSSKMSQFSIISLLSLSLVSLLFSNL